MATKLSDLEITKVDFVDAGANPDAHIMLFKRNDQQEPVAEQPVEQEQPNLWKRFFGILAKAVGVSESEISSLDEEVTKACKEEKVCDEETKKTDSTSTGKTNKVDPADNEDETEEEKPSVGKGVVDVKIDKSKMTPAEKAMLEEFEKKYGSESAPETVPTAAPSAEDIVNKALETLGIQKAAEQPEETDDIYKGMSAEAKQELEDLKKYKQEKEESELRAVAKGYECIGQTEDALFPVLKSLKATSQEAYDLMIKSLDSQKDAFEKSGLFSEIGKSSHQHSAANGEVASVEKRAEDIAKGLMEKDPSLGYFEAMAQAWNTPGLLAQYDEVAGY